MMIIEVNLDTGNRNFPVVSGFRLNFCGDKNCGPHFFLLDKDDQVFCEFIMSPQQFADVETKMLTHHRGIPRPETRVKTIEPEVQEKILDALPDNSTLALEILAQLLANILLSIPSTIDAHIAAVKRHLQLYEGT